MSTSKQPKDVVIGVLALQGAFEEHQNCIEQATGCKTIQVRKPSHLNEIDGIILPGGESTAMGLIGSTSTDNLWIALQTFILTQHKPTWGTCAGMILLAERCVGASAVITNGQSLIGGMDVLVCRNYFGSQVSSFEMDTDPPPGFEDGGGTSEEEGGSTKEGCVGRRPYPGVFIRAPAILNVAPTIDILGKVVATPCRQAAVVLRDLEDKMKRGEEVVMMGVVDALERTKDRGISYQEVIRGKDTEKEEEEKGATSVEDGNNTTSTPTETKIVLPGAADGTNAREIISAARKDNILITAFHPELTEDYRWHSYFHRMVVESLSS